MSTPERSTGIGTRQEGESDAPIRMGYVGAGFMAQHVHLANFSTLPGCRLMALAEARPQLAKRVAARFGISDVRANHLELAADPSLEAIGVSAGFVEQGQIAADLLRAGKHVFMEKPMAVSLAQADTLLEAARVGKARLMVGYMKRHDPGVVLARRTVADWLGSGRLGRPVLLRNHGFGGQWLSRLDRSEEVVTDEPRPSSQTPEGLWPDWLPSDQRAPYVSYLQQYTHNVNLVRYLLDAGDRASVTGADLDDDGLTGLVTLNVAGVRTTIESATTAYHDWDEHTQIYFERGWVKVSSPPLMARAAQATVEVYEAGSEPSLSTIHAGPLTAWPYREEAAEFLRCLRTGDPFRSSGEDTRTDVRICEEVYQHRLVLQRGNGPGVG